MSSTSTNKWGMGILISASVAPNEMLVTTEMPILREYESTTEKEAIDNLTSTEQSIKQSTLIRTERGTWSVMQLEMENCFGSLVACAARINMLSPTMMITQNPLMLGGCARLTTLSGTGITAKEKTGVSDV